MTSYTKSNDNINVSLAKISYQLEALDARAQRLEDAQKLMKVEIDQITDAANKWRGGLVVVLALGSIAGWVITFGSNLKFW